MTGVSRRDGGIYRRPRTAQSVYIPVMSDISSALSAVSASLVSAQAQASLIAIRIANENQRQIVDLLTANASLNSGASANPEHLGNLIDTLA